MPSVGTVETESEKKSKESRWWVNGKEDDTLSSKASVTSKTFVAPKVFILRNSDWLCLRAHNLRLIHAKFHCASLRGLAFTWFWKLMKFQEILLWISYFSAHLHLKNPTIFTWIEQKNSIAHELTILHSFFAFSCTSGLF